MKIDIILKLKAKRSITLLLTAFLSMPVGASDLPKDVVKLLESRESCDHWRGEEGYDAERKADIAWAICASCTGTDEKLALLKKKYRDNKSVMDKLNELEPNVESKDKAEAKLSCSKTRKPAWAQD